MTSICLHSIYDIWSMSDSYGVQQSPLKQIFYDDSLSVIVKSHNALACHGSNLALCIAFVDIYYSRTIMSVNFKVKILEVLNISEIF